MSHHETSTPQASPADLSAIAADPVLREQMIALLGLTPAPKEHDPRRGPFPPNDEITFVHASLLDNGPGQKTTTGAKAKGPRYKLALEIWTQPADKISRQRDTLNVVFDKNIGLRGRKEFVALCYKNVRSGKISEAYNQFVLDITGKASGPGWLFGSNIDRNDVTSGATEWTWHDHQFVVLAMEGETPISLLVFTDPQNCFLLDNFEKNEGSSKYVYSAHLDRVGYFAARDARKD